MGQRSRATGDRVGAVVDVMRSPDLRRLQLGWAAYFLVDGASLVALSVWAFRDQGASAVGLVGLARLLPGAVALPFGAWAADRFSRRRVVVGVLLAIAVTQAALAVALASGVPAAVVYVLVAGNSVAATPYRPAQLALAPLVARSPQELVAMNVTAGTLEGLVTFVGPAVAALLLVTVAPWLVLAVCAVAALAGVLAVARIDVGIDPVARRNPERPRDALTNGFVELRANIDMSVIVGCFVAQILVRGLLSVLVVSVSFDLVDLGASGVGWLTAAVGIGGMVGAAYAVTMTGRRRLGGPFALALVLWGLPIAVIGLVPHTVVVVGALVTVGIGNALLDVAGFTLLQRLGSDRSLGRVFGVLFTCGIAMAGLGSLAAPRLISLVGLRPALVVVGLVLPSLTAVLLPRFRSIDARSEPLPDVLALLGAMPMLTSLPPTTLEKLATRAAVVEAVTGDVIVTEGEPGRLFYAIADGDVDVSQGGRHHRTLGPGDAFGEIALLRGTTRTATVVARSPTRLVTIDGRDFVDALSTSQAAFSFGWGMTDELLRRDQDGGWPQS